MVSKKNKIVAALLAFFFGGLGIHKFYLGRVGQGILYILFCWTGIPSIIAFIEFIIFLVEAKKRLIKSTIFITSSSNLKLNFKEGYTVPL